MKEGEFLQFDVSENMYFSQRPDTSPSYRDTGKQHPWRRSVRRGPRFQIPPGISPDRRMAQEVRSIGLPGPCHIRWAPKRSCWAIRVCEDGFRRSSQRYPGPNPGPIARSRPILSAISFSGSGNVPAFAWRGRASGLGRFKCTHIRERDGRRGGPRCGFPVSRTTTGVLTKRRSQDARSDAKIAGTA